VTGSKLELIN